MEKKFEFRATVHVENDMLRLNYLNDIVSRSPDPPRTPAVLLYRLGKLLLRQVCQLVQQLDRL